MKKRKPVTSPQYSAGQRLRPTHLEIAAEAEVLWRQKGCPQGADKEIWLAKDEADMIALDDPLSRLDRKSDDVMGELEELFPSQTGKSETSL